MASVVESPKGSGRYEVHYIDSAKRPKIRLGNLGKGKPGRKKAEGFRDHLEELLQTRKYGYPLGPVTQEWLKTLDRPVLERMAELGLVAVRREWHLGEWLDECIQGRKGRCKPQSIRKLENTKRLLLGFLDAGWDRWMQGKEDLSEATRKTMAGNAKTFFNEAVGRELIVRNPFRYLVSGVTARDDNRYIPPDDIAKIIDACPNTEWALLFGLARYAGLRIPSESRLLT